MTDSGKPLPFVSVVMTAFNAEKWLAEAIDSTLRQTHTQFELLIVDDGSKDRTGAIIAEYAALDDRVVPINHENWGMGASLNHAISLASAEWIARMDADDIMEPNRLERQVAFIQDNPDVDVASTLVHMIDERSNALWSTSTDMVNRTTFSHYVRDNRIMPIFHPAVIMKKSVVEAVGGYRSRYWSADDMDLWNRIAEQGHLILIQPEHLLQYRVHVKSVSAAATRDQFLKLHWVIRSTVCRREGLPEPTFDEYLSYERGKPFWPRLNTTRRLWAEVLYKNSTVLYIGGQRLRSLPPMLAAVALSPRASMFRVKPKLKKLVVHRSLSTRVSE